MKMIIQSPQFSPDKKLLELVQQKLSKLHQYYDRIVELQVFLKLENSGQIKDKIVELKMIVPGDKLFVEGKNKTFESAIDEVPVYRRGN